MKKLLAGVFLILVLQSVAVANVLTNGSFEDGLTGWSWSGYEPSILGYPSHFCSADYQYSILRQDVHLAPGAYHLDFSAYYHWNDMPRPDLLCRSWPHILRLAVLADGLEVAQAEFSGYVGVPWTQAVFPTQEVYVNDTVSVVMTLDTAIANIMYWVGDCDGHWESTYVYGHLYVDDVVLTAAPVPEPSGIMLLLSGAAGIAAGMRRKLRA